MIHATNLKGGIPCKQPFPFIYNVTRKKLPVMFYCPATLAEFPKSGVHHLQRFAGRCSSQRCFNRNRRCICCHCHGRIGAVRSRYIPSGWHLRRYAAGIDSRNIDFPERSSPNGGNFERIYADCLSSRSGFFAVAASGSCCGGFAVHLSNRRGAV